ncbi:MAG TPA: amino acid-binding protein, partial [Planctomycetes bacterium]|nr:amino acid-binding protein [Planctomycetota bacterium]
MRTAKQLSVSLVNKPGRLAAMLAALNKGKVSFRALVVMDSGDRGKVRFVPDDFAAATQVLEKANIRYETADVLLVEVPNQPGAFRKVCERLAADHLNIDYAYSALGSQSGSKAGLAVIKVNDLAKAQRVLSENGSVTRR